MFNLLNQHSLTCMSKNPRLTERKFPENDKNKVSRVMNNKTREEKGVVDRKVAVRYPYHTDC